MRIIFVTFSSHMSSTLQSDTNPNKKKKNLYLADSLRVRFTAEMSKWTDLEVATRILLIADPLDNLRNLLLPLGHLPYHHHTMSTIKQNTTVFCSKI